MVGCVIVASDGRLRSWGFHARCGGEHAEVAALARVNGDARGSTAYVTLEPCCHHGRTGPCADALIAAGISRVVYAVSDPHPQARGGGARLRDAGVRVDRVEHDASTVVASPFLCRTLEGRPWVIAKWAQTLDGRTATRTGDSRWISGVRSRAMVHRERARVDAVMVGIGTVLADDPHLLPRCSGKRRVPRRIIIDPALATPIDAQIVKTVAQGPVTIAAARETIDALTTHARRAWDNAGVTLLALEGQDDPSQPHLMRGISKGMLRVLLRRLHEAGIATLLVEGGAGLFGALLDEDLVDDAWCFVAPLAAADSAGAPVAEGPGRIQMLDSLPFRLLDVRRRGADAMLLWRRQRGSGTGGSTDFAAGSRTL